MKGFKKSLGQNFFNNPNLADQICNIIQKDNPTGILEIGPGDGYFTKRLSIFCENVIAIEKDSSLLESLSAKIPKVHFLNNDFFDVNINSLDLGSIPVVFGSLPYNVARLIIKYLLENTNIQTFYFILQKEVALKFTQTDKSSLQYITTKLFVDSKLIYNISSGSFIPRPKVESAFVQMKRNMNINLVDKTPFINLVKQAFASPRKTLRNNLKPILKDSTIESELFSRRPEDLKFEDFISLYNIVKVI